MKQNYKSDYLLTLGVMIAVMVATMVIYRIAQSQFGAQGFAEISLTKRIMGFLVALMGIGMGVGIPREVARVDGTELDGTKYEILRNSLLVIFALMVVFFAGIILFSRFVTQILFGDAKFHYLMLPMAIALQGSLVNGIAYSYFRGLNCFLVANSLLAVTFVVCPIVTIVFLSKDIASYLTIWGIFLSFLSLLYLSRHLIKGSSKLFGYQTLAKVTFYSIRRLPGDIALQLMFAIPPILIAHVAGFKAAGDFAFSITVLTLVTVPLSSASRMLLSRTMALLNDRRTDILRKVTGDAFIYVCAGSAMVGIVLMLGAERAIGIFLPERHDFDFLFLKGVVLVVLPYSAYVYLRSVIDAVHDKAYNSVNCIISLFVFMASAALSRGLLSARMGLVCSLVLAFYTLGILTYRRVHLDRRNLLYRGKVITRSSIC